ncbi:MAG: thiamine pyrophosphate-dependent dehydrogenase E1 component subunit alpha [Lachnospiraceae bacterium]|nr:thiamine pyrophosphate-dependent dehydrogenase E1 component subunit alpha [Lachnospiraceae bacterium]
MESAKLLSCYQEMLKTRLFQKKLLDHGMGIYTDRGEEAITVGACKALKETDIVTCYFRGEGSVIRLKGGISLEEQMSCWLGRLDEHEYINALPPVSWTDVEHGVVGTSSSLIGADADICVGVALAQKMQKTGNVVMFMSGDGAASKGNFHEMFNWAGKFSLPLIIMIRGNQWAMSTSSKENLHVTGFADMVEPYGIKAWECDGNDVVSVYDTVAAAAEYSRSTGPSLIYARSYRMSAHSAHDEDDYRDPAVLEEWSRKDPLILAEKALMDMGCTKKEIDEAGLQVEESIDQAYDRALSLPEIQLKDYYQSQLEVVRTVGSVL